MTLDGVMQRLKEFSPKQGQGYVEITFPIVVYLNGGLLTLRVTPQASGYTISCPDDFFSEANGSQEYYFRMFEKWDKRHHYGMRIADGVIYKQYAEEDAITVAINEVVRFFILFDDFFIENGVIGKEEEFA